MYTLSPSLSLDFYWFSYFATMESKLLRAPSPSVSRPWFPKLPSSSPIYTYYSRRSCIFPARLSTLRIQASTTPDILAKKDRVDESHCYTLDGIRSSLNRQEDSIIVSVVERAQYCYNADTYDPNASFMDGVQGSLVEFMVKETEKLHARVGRYKSPDEHPFFPNGLPEPMLPPLQYPQVLHPISESININKRVWDMYFSNLLPRLVKKGDDGNYGSTAVCDIIYLQKGNILEKPKGEIQLFHDTHFTEKNGWVGLVSKLHYKMVELQTSEENEMSEAEICAEVLGNKCSYVKGRGFGPLPESSKSRHSQGGTRADTEELRSEVQHLKELLAANQTRNEAILKKFQEFVPGLADLFTEDTDLS